MLYEQFKGYERELRIADAGLENEYSKLNTLLEMVAIKDKQNTLDAEYRVFAESGTNEDLVFLYEAAEKEATEVSKNIFKKIVEWFGKVVSAIGAKIKGLATKNVSDGADVKLDKGTEEGIKNANSIFNKMSSGINKLKAGKFADAWSDLKGIVIPTLAVGGVVTTGAIMYKKGKLDSVLKNIEDKSKSIAEVVTTAAKKVPDNMQKILNKIIAPLKKFVSYCSSLSSSIVSAIASAGKKAGESVKDVAKKVTGKEKVEESVSSIYGVDLFLLSESVETETDDTIDYDLSDTSYIESILDL